MKQEIIKCLEDPKVINFKDEWLASENQMESDILSAFCFYDIDPVSYTHLDVYKRQSIISKDVSEIASRL